MNSWIKPQNGEIILQWGKEAPVRILVVGSAQPVVVANGKEYHPTGWHGPARGEAGISRWEFSAGPIPALFVRLEPNGDRWVLVDWK